MRVELFHRTFHIFTIDFVIVNAAVCFTALQATCRKCRRKITLSRSASSE